MVPIQGVALHLADDRLMMALMISAFTGCMTACGWYELHMKITRYIFAISCAACAAGLFAGGRHYKDDDLSMCDLCNR
jgi:hypothetical protein